MKIEIIQPEVNSREYTRRMRSFTESKQYFDLVIEIEGKMRLEQDRHILKEYYIEVNKVMDKYKLKMNAYLSMTHIPGKFKRGTKRRTVGENLDFNKSMRKKIDECRDNYDFEGIGKLLIETEEYLKTIPKPTNMAEKRELDRVHSVIIYGIDKIRKMVKVKYDDNNEFRTNIIDRKWKNRHRDPEAMARKAARKELKEERKAANNQIRNKFNVGEKYLWTTKGEIVEVINHGKMLWLKRYTTTKPVRIIDINENELIKINEEE